MKQFLLYASMLAIPAGLAQTPAPPAVPAQFASAKTVFLGYGGAPSTAYSPLATHIAKDLYTQGSQAIAATSRFRLVPDPSSADLCMAISLDSISSGANLPATYVRLTVNDCKTNVLIWTMEEGITSIPFFSKENKEIGKSISKFTAELNQLASGKLP